MRNQNNNPAPLLILILIFLFLLVACGSKNETPTPALMPTAVLPPATETPEPAADTPTPQPTDVPPTETPTPLPTETPQPTATPTPAPLQLAQSATVRIVVEGSAYLETLIGSGTGVIYNSSGLVLTSNHLVDGAGLIQVSVEGREESLTAQIVGRSPCDNLAVLQLLGSEFPAVSLSSSDSLDDNILVIGYTVGDTSQSIVETALEEEIALLSAGFAEISSTLQIDTALNTGYSGAPVVTEDGLFTGLVVYTGSVSPDAGQHAAVSPLSQINLVLAQLETGNNLNWIGVNAGPISAASAEQIGIEAAPGLFVYAVDFRGPGGQADVRNGDFITEIAGEDVTGADGLDIYCSVLRGMADEEALDIVVMRGGNRYLGQIFGDPLAEEVIVVETLPEETTDDQPPAGDTKSTLLAIMQNTKSELQSVGGTIDSLANNGCLNPPLLAASSEGGPGNMGVEGETLAHPGCIHSITDCEIILASYGRITNPPVVDLTNADQAVINANNSHQAAIATFAQSASSLIEACRSFVTDPNLTIGPLAFGLARQGITDAVTILTPAIELLQSG